SNSKSSSAEVMINGELRKISLRGIYEPSSDDYGAVVLVSGTEGYNGQYTIAKNQRMTLSDSEWFELRNVEEDYIEVYASVNAYGTTEKIAGSKTDYRVDKNKITLVGEKRYEIKLLETNLKKLAKVSIIPTIDNSGTSANFSFKVGIEKRAIQLSPEKIKEKIDSLEETITEWEDKSESLGNIVQGLKGACLATGAILTIKNFLENTDGKAIARTNVMRGVGGVYEECEKISGKGMIYSSVDECMNNKSDEIDAKVDAMYNLIQSQNQELKLAHEGCGFTEFLTEKHVDTACFKEKYLSASKTELKNNLADTIMCNNENVNADKLIDDLKSTQISTEDLKNLVLNSRAQSNSNLNVLSQTRLKTTFCGVYENTRTEIKAVEFADEFKIASEKVNLILKKDAKEQKYNELKYKDVKERVVIADNDVGDIPVQIKDSTPVASILTSEGKEYVAVLAKSGDKYVIQQLYDLNGKKVNDNLNVYFKKYDDSSYKNVYQNPEAKYYETEPHKGLPALIPFDKDNGWYVYIKQTLPVVGGIKTYDDSGRVSSFYLCNVGENRREEKMSGDDICQMINLGTGQPYNIFSGMQDKQEVSKIVSRAIENVESVSKQYKDGISQVYVTDLSGKRWTVKVGSPAADIPDMQCQDFMSPKDCKRLFNVCDPVICPSSRCDLGGAYPVKDVIQSGIIGSLVLCLPNYREGILFPVCLTGIKAGIDGLLSVYKSYRDCLQESLDTGETVGICDEIYSIHLCEFFWRQGLPLAKIAIPKVLEIILGQNIRGGGEYLGLASAWGAAENSVTYFTQYYAANSYKAFKARNAEEVGGEVCKSFISGVYPSGGNVLEQLTEPDSPPQFHGRFDEIPFTTATVPPISHYKVFYHIYAGKDSRAYYQVYLSEGATSSYYQDASYKRIVGSGYISRGEYATETADFTASSGYKKLCIRVNEQEECGFKQVSTSYAIDYIEDKYLEEQALQTDIKKESECISGTASLYSLISPNIQEGVDEAIDPSIYNRGITRICATENPGKGTDVYWNIPNKSRWIEVGYCDNQNIKCWLSRESVGNVINDADIKASVLKEHEKNALELLESEGTILNDQEVNQKITEIKKMSDSNEIINKINEIFDKVILNNYKAELLLLRGGAYGKLAIIEFYKTMKGTSSTEMTDTLDYAVNINDWVVSGSILKPATNLDRFTEKYKTQISDTKYSDPISKYSKEYNVDENLIKAIITQESYPLKETAVERAGSYGLMQVSSGAAEDVGMSGLFKNNQWAIPDNNIKIGTAYYKLLYDKYGDKRLALAAYNCGLGNVDKICSDKNWDSCTKEGFEKYCPNNDVLQYVSNILAYEIKFKNKDYN
ncbi:MAG: transglycosylase SLT domain-containing protein, partial [Nanoarchaeota archaeon]|nr:transglycosylase SLT domain-containing protein [Nanoarchaeota archaeon]